MSTMSTDRRGRDGEGGATYLRRGDYRLAFPPDRTALLVIDPVNDFLSEGGAGWEMAKGTVRKHDVIGHLKRAIAGARVPPRLLRQYPVSPASEHGPTVQQIMGKQVMAPMSRLRNRPSPWPIVDQEML
ncbi:hypothetical protein [Tautonia sociabilis]|uniref:hypothetical protein n=1 Tax=Tautonia sociabilis TaxID=2080755 RepID=UPI0018F62DDC|nr:hypothetical protein [Tautonia sociabilis]